MTDRPVAQIRVPTPDDAPAEWRFAMPSSSQPSHLQVRTVRGKAFWWLRYSFDSVNHAISAMSRITHMQF